MAARQGRIPRVYIELTQSFARILAQPAQPTRHIPDLRRRPEGMNYTQLTDPSVLDFRPPAAYFDSKARAGVRAASGNRHPVAQVKEPGKDRQ